MKFKITKEDAEILEENEELRQNILEFFNVYFISLKDLGKQDNLKLYLPSILKFIYEVNSDYFYPSLVNKNYFKSK